MSYQDRENSILMDGAMCAKRLEGVVGAVICKGLLALNGRAGGSQK